VKVTTHCPLVLGLRKQGAMSPLPYMPLWDGQEQIWYITSITVLNHNFEQEIFFQYLITYILTSMFMPPYCTICITDLVCQPSDNVNNEDYQGWGK
jgi:hypothetical protein